MEEGEDVIRINTCSKHEALQIVKELNRACLLGFRAGQPAQTT